jgi:mono/diheme cytochrome c family protein
VVSERQTPGSSLKFLATRRTPAAQPLNGEPEAGVRPSKHRRSAGRQRYCFPRAQTFARARCTDGRTGAAERPSHPRVHFAVEFNGFAMWRLGIFAALAVACSAAAIGVWTAAAPRPPFRPDDPRLQSAGDADRGRMVFALGDCASCHATPGQSNRLRLGGGLALTSPYGTFRVPNISPDRSDGIGSWTPADLANALIGGVSPQQTHYYPVFPYTSFTGMHLEDVKDLMAYLRTLPPVSGRPPPHDLSLLFRVRGVIGLWKLLFFHEGRPLPSSGDDRGVYLVETIGHCAECHSARNAFGAIKSATRFAGAVDPEGVGFIPNITPQRLGRWSQADIAEMLSSGETPDHGRVGSSMAEVVVNTASLPQSDREAMARYIKSLPARPTPKP